MVNLEHQPIQLLMFHANDTLKHDVYWSSLAKSWALENINELCDTDGFDCYFDSLPTALENMEELSGNDSKTISVTLNPYG